MSLLREPLPALIAGAGYGRREPVIAGVHRPAPRPGHGRPGLKGPRRAGELPFLMIAQDPV
ncbi:MAG TPA: hypothetical protein VK599_20450 [Streptosporangiaceae bacterium]|nr:hypothetical protein [Streptosporangiaceae bacterium]